MTTFFYTHESAGTHDTGPGHPERIERYDSILTAVSGPDFFNLKRCSAPEATLDQLSLAHDRDHVARIIAEIPQSGRAQLDPDTVVSPGSYEAALRAAGAVCSAVDAVVDGDAKTAFCGMRPPGHHAEPHRSMGFCVFNSIAVGALHAREAHGISRIAVVDFDVHHGNGTQAVFENDPNLFYGSTHQYPFYPGTGAKTETGVSNNVVNMPLAAFSGSREFNEAVISELIPAMEIFEPELVLVSAGFDAHEDDPLGQLRLSDADFVEVTKRLQDVANRFAGGRLVSSLEGGYDLTALSRCVGAHVAELMKQ